MTTAAADRSTEFYDESLEPDGSPRPGYAEIFDVVAATGPGELSRRVDESMQRIGATFGSDDGAQGFPVCPIPRLIGAREWRWLERGLAQRARALNAFIADIYGDRDIVRAGVIGTDVLAGVDYFEPAMVGLLQPAGHAPLIG